MPLTTALTIALATAAVFVNGWTDAPNAITGAVASGALSYNRAVGLAAACNLAGLLAFGAVNGSVTETVARLMDFGAGARPPQEALAALLASMAAICCFAVGAWGFGLPTSESHALAASLAGATFALGGAQNNAGAWGLIAAGVVLSLVLGFFGGRLTRQLLGGWLTRLKPGRLERLQAAAAGLMAFMHGAQDGQKFAAVFIVARGLLAGETLTGPINLREHPLILLLCGAAMALGTAVGARRIVETVGAKMMTVKKHEGFSADLGGGAALLLMSLFGIPASTTQVKISALAGAVRAQKNPAIFGGMLLAWAVTFPVCGALGYAFTRVFLIFC